MGKKSFAICDSNEVYARKLYDYFFVKESESYELFLFTSRDELENFASKRHIEIVLISDQLIGSKEEMSNVDHVIRLKSEEANLSTSEIYKYKSGESILKEVMYYCAQKASEPGRRECGRPLRIIGVYSPVKRCFQTSFSITLGQILAQRGKTIYLNFESFSGFDVFRKSQVNQDITDLIYSLTCGSHVEYKTKEDDDYKKEERENIIKILSKKYYIPSLQESIAGALLLCGVISIGLYIYLGWI